MANVLVTGGAGFIGSHIATRLVELGHDVRVFDDLSTGRRENLAQVNDKIELIRADMRNVEECLRACMDMEFVFHQAAIPSVPKSVDAPLESHEANIGGTFNMLQAAVYHKVRRFVYAASSSAYGDADVSPKHEGIAPQPMSPYAVQKLTGEHYCRAFSEVYSLQTISLRYFNVFGSRQDPKSRYAAAIPAFVMAILRGEPPTVYGDGEQTRDFTYVDNVVHGNILAMDAKRTRGEMVNVASGQRISVNQVIRDVNRVLGTDVKPRYVDRRLGDVMHSHADVSAAKALLGYELQVTFEDGLGRTIDYYRSIAGAAQ